MLDKALYELNYELNNRPDWVRIPLAVILGDCRRPDPECSARVFGWCTAAMARHRGVRDRAGGFRFGASHARRWRSRRAARTAPRAAAAGTIRSPIGGATASSALRVAAPAPAIATLLHRSTAGRPPDPASRFQPEACTARRKSSTPRFAGRTRWRGRRDPRGPGHLRAARRHLHAGGHVRARASSCPARSRRHRDRADAGRRLRRRRGTGATTASRSSRRRAPTAGRTTCARSSTPRTALGLAVILDVVYNHLGTRGRVPAAVPARHTSPIGTHAVGAAVNLDGPARRRSSALHHRQRAALDPRVPARRPAARRDARADRRQRRASSRSSPRRRGGGRRPATSITRRITATWRRWSRTPSAAAGGSTASGPTTSTTSSGACWPATRTATIATTPGTVDELAHDAAAGLAVHGASTPRTAAAARHRSRRGADAPVRGLPAEPRSDRQSRARRSAASPVDAAAWRAASVLLLTAPMTPLLFMGQEWAPRARRSSTSPISSPSWGELVTEGRRREFADSRSSPIRRASRIPDPAGRGDVRASRLRLARANAPARAALARSTPSCSRCAQAHRRSAPPTAVPATPRPSASDDRRDARDGAARRSRSSSRAAGPGPREAPHADRPTARPRDPVSTEDPAFAPILAAAASSRGRLEIVRFRRPGAIILKRTRGQAR